MATNTHGAVMLSGCLFLQWFSRVTLFWSFTYILQKWSGPLPDSTRVQSSLALDPATEVRGWLCVDSREIFLWLP